MKLANFLIFLNAQEFITFFLSGAETEQQKFSETCHAVQEFCGSLALIGDYQKLGQIEALKDYFVPVPPEDIAERISSDASFDVNRVVDGKYRSSEEEEELEDAPPLKGFIAKEAQEAKEA